MSNNLKIRRKKSYIRWSENSIFIIEVNLMIPVREIDISGYKDQTTGKRKLKERKIRPTKN
jgi:hypothetical protein